MKREAKKLFTSNGVPAGLVCQAMGRMIMVDAAETPRYNLYGLKNYWVLNFWMHEDSTGTIAKNTKFNAN